LYLSIPTGSAVVLVNSFFFCISLLFRA
jgi:hypothetical protein